jgi:hypothetical protein
LLLKQSVVVVEAEAVVVEAEAVEAEAVVVAAAANYNHCSCHSSGIAVKSEI